MEWGGYLINIVDTPGHADFSGEVERVLSMVDSVLLLVDANEGPMPQTRYVLMRALRLGLRPIVVVNKVDRPNADPHGALDKTFDLFLELGATDEQADFPVVYGSALEGWIVRDPDNDPHEGMDALFETIIAEVPPPKAKLDAPFRMQVSTLAWSDYLGRIGCGRVLEGTHRKGEELVRTSTVWKGQGRETDADAGDWEVTGTETARSAHLWVTRGLEREEVDEIQAGDIVWLNGPTDITIGDTLSAPDLVDPALPPLEIEEPTVSMFFLVNNGPFSGRDGNAVTLRQIKDRLERELRVNVALRVEDLGRPDGVKVSGRGELHLGILIEEMRREGMELCVSRPEVITHTDAKGHVLEPMEQLTVDVPNEYQGIVIEKLAQRKGEITAMHDAGTGMVRLEFTIPTRGLIGYRGDFLTDTRGLGIMASRFVGYEPWRGEVAHRDRGSLVSMENGPATGYSLENLQQRGTLFVSPMDPVYAGHDRGRALPRRRHGLQPHQDQEAGQLPVREQRDRRGPQGAPGHDPGPGPGMDRRRRTGGDHAQDGAGAQGHPGRQRAQRRPTGASRRPRRLRRAAHGEAGAYGAPQVHDPLLGRRRQRSRRLRRHLRPDLQPRTPHGAAGPPLGAPTSASDGSARRPVSAPRPRR